MSVFGIDVYSDKEEALVSALNFIKTNQWGDGLKAIGYKNDLDKGLIFYSYSSGSEEISLFPYKFFEVELLPIIKGWLKIAVYGEAPDTDGSVKKGWRIHNSPTELGYGQKVIFAVKPRWIVYGK